MILGEKSRNLLFLLWNDWQTDGSSKLYNGCSLRNVITKISILFEEEAEKITFPAYTKVIKRF